MKTITLATALVIAYGLCATRARADFIDPTTGQFAVLGESSGAQTNFNNGTITGDIGLGTPRQFTISNASVNGNIRFSGASNTSGMSPNPSPGSGAGPFTVSGGGTVAGGVFAGDPAVTAALGFVNNLSAMLGGEAGTPLSLTSSQTINASSGVLDASGNRVFSTSNVNLNNGTILTINGSASDFVDINVSSPNPAFNGQIVLTGGITPDHVLFNMFTGGTLTISTNGQTTTGIFLDPNGSMQMNHSLLVGRFFGGDNSNQQIVSGAFIEAPPPPVSGVPLPRTAAAGGALLLIVAVGARLRRRTQAC